mgnify:CR=1 FL=1
MLINKQFFRRTDMELTTREDRIYLSDKARKRRKSLKQLRELRQHRFYAKQKKKRNKV